MADTVAIPGVWLDLDTREGRHLETSLPSTDEALDLLDNLPIAPTLVLHSGGGLYPWWLFREPWVFDDEEERDRAAALVAGWQEFVIALAAAKGWQLDCTSDLARVLRAEGTPNGKYDPPRLVRRIRGDGPRWNPCDLEEWAGLFGRGRPRAAIALQAATEPPSWLAPALEALGTSGRSKCDGHGALVAIVLDLCPACRGIQQASPGTARGTAHIVPTSGVLRCKRQSCEAREAPGGGGLALEQWVRRYAPDVADSVLAERSRQRDGVLSEIGARRPTIPENAVCVPVAASEPALRETLERAVEASMSARVLAQVVAPVGSGKTRAAAEMIAQRRHVAYFAPTHQLIEEMAAELEKRGVPFVHARGVASACSFSDAHKASGRRRDWRGLACLSCPDRTGCAAWETARPGVPLLAPFDLYRTIRDGEEKPLEGRVVLIDEPASFVEELRIGPKVLAGLHAPSWGPSMVGNSGRVGRAVSRLLGSARERRSRLPPKRWGDRLHDSEISRLWSEVADDDDTRRLLELASMNLEAWPRPGGAALRGGKVCAAEWPSPELHGFVRALFAAVGEGKQAEVWANEHGRAEVVVTDESVWFESCRSRPLKLWPDRGAVLLDATGALALAETKAAHAGTRVEVFGLDVEAAEESVRVHVRSWAGARRRTLIDGAPTPEAVARVRREVRKARQEARTRLKIVRPKVCVLTHKPLAEGLLRLQGTVDEEDRPDEVGWYGRHDRGTNRFEGVDVLLTFGDPLGNLGAIEAQARALGIESNELAACRAAATIAQAHGRARWLHHGALLVHVGHVLPPDWGGRFEYEERVREAGRPRAPSAEALLGAARLFLAQRGWVAAWALDEVKGQNPLKGIPLGDSVLSPGALRKAAPRAVARAAAEVGAVPVEASLPGRAGRAVWALPGTLDRAVKEATELWSRRRGR